jgi:hypothetical protein
MREPIGRYRRITSPGFSATEEVSHPGLRLISLITSLIGGQAVEMHDALPG